MGRQRHWPTTTTTKLKILLMFMVQNSVQFVLVGSEKGAVMVLVVAVDVVVVVVLLAVCLFDPIEWQEHS